MIQSNISVGSDPEYAAFENNTPRSAVDQIPGSKKQPYPLTENGEFSIQIDNVGVEGCIPPAYTKQEFINYMRIINKLAELKLQERQPNWHIRSVSSARYSQEDLSTPTAKMFGCDPSYDAYTMSVSERPLPKDVGNLRSFGFHIHIGYKCDKGDDAIDYAVKIIKAMDITTGLGSIIFDTDTDRRSIYGNPGDFRFRQIEDVNIVEYRTLGGAMHRNDALVGWVYDGVMKAIELANNWTEENDKDAFMAAIAIKANDINMCTAFMDKYNIEHDYSTITERSLVSQ